MNTAITRLMIDIADVLRDHIEKRIRSGDMECQTDECDSRAFDVRVWKNADGTPEGAAICRECDTRINITMSKSELQQLQDPLDSLEKEIKKLQKELDKF